MKLLLDQSLTHKLPDTLFQTIFQQPDAQSTWTQARKVVDLLEPKFPQVAAYLEESV